MQPSLAPDGRSATPEHADPVSARAAVLPHRRRRSPRGIGAVLLRQSRGRRHHELGLSHWPVRGGERAHRPSVSGRGRRHRHARPTAGRGGHGVHRARRVDDGERGVGRRAPSLRQDAPRQAPLPEARRVRRRATADSVGEDHAYGAAEGLVRSRGAVRRRTRTRRAARRELARLRWHDRRGSRGAGWLSVWWRPL